MTEGPKIRHGVMVALGKIRQNPWNSNVMSADEFNRLAEEIGENGFLAEIQVVPDAGADTYMIIGGEHRWQAYKILGMAEIPCCIMEDEKFQDRDLQEQLSVRLNSIHGKQDPEKLMRLVERAMMKHEKSTLGRLFGYTDETAWNKLVGEHKKSLKEIGMPTEVIEHFEEAAKEVKTVEDLSRILNSLFAKYGNTLRWNFMVFEFGGKEHMYVSCDERLWKILGKLRLRAAEKAVDMNEVLAQALVGYADLPCLKDGELPE